MNDDQYYMKLALDLAASAKGKTNQIQWSGQS